MNGWTADENLRAVKRCLHPTLKPEDQIAKRLDGAPASPRRWQRGHAGTCVCCKRMHAPQQEHVWEAI
jgi:hypothetical protein